MKNGRKLLFILADRLSLLVKKGEMIPRYYNPGDFFREVHLLTTSNDLVDSSLVASMAGNAKVFVHRLWRGDDRLNMGMTPLLQPVWKARAVGLAREIDPDMVRTGDRLTGYLGHAIKVALGIPHIISLHTHRDDLRIRTSWGLYRFMMELDARYARAAFKDADAVIIVYESIRSYAEKYGARRIEKIYNVISPEQLLSKESYSLSVPPKIISVGRQLARKKPDRLLLAMRNIDAELLLIGEGECHTRLRHLVAENGLHGKVSFQPSMPNAEVCKVLETADIFAAHTNYPELPKTVMEALWRGLPVLVNEDQTLPVPELQGDWVYRVPNTSEGYSDGLQDLLRDEILRERLGRCGRSFAQKHFDPREMEEHLIRLYGEFIG
jgi:glycosyltransferase involved in cell wall biosynthesis